MLWYELRIPLLPPPNLARSRRQLDRPDRPPGSAAASGCANSAPMRRGAAPYGNGCEQISGHSHLISLSILCALCLSSRLTWHDFVYVTMAPLYYVYYVPAYGCFKVTYSNDLENTPPRQGPGLVPTHWRIPRNMVPEEVSARVKATPCHPSFTLYSTLPPSAGFVSFRF